MLIGGWSATSAFVDIRANSAELASSILIHYTSSFNYDWGKVLESGIGGVNTVRAWN